MIKEFSGLLTRHWGKGCSVLLALAVASNASAGLETRFQGAGGISFYDRGTVGIQARYAIEKPFLEIPKLWGSSKTLNRWRLEFDFNDEKMAWESNRPPVIVNAYNGNLYVVSLKYTNSPVFEFERYVSGKWQTIQANDFPKPIARQNLRPELWAGSEFNRVAFSEPLDLSDPKFPISYTANLWWILSGHPPGEELQTIDSAFLQAFKREHFEPSLK